LESTAQRIARRQAVNRRHQLAVRVERHFCNAWQPLVEAGPTQAVAMGRHQQRNLGRVTDPHFAVVTQGGVVAEP